MCPNRDLAIIMRKKLGDWHRVLTLLKGAPGTPASTQFSDAQMDEAYTELGDQLADRHQWRAALGYYLLGHNQDRIIRANLVLEDFKYLQEMAVQLPDNDPHLPVRSKGHPYIQTVFSYSLPLSMAGPIFLYVLT